MNIRRQQHLRTQLPVFALLLLLGAVSFAASDSPPSMPDLKTVQPQMTPFSAQQIDVMAEKSHLTDCFWVGTVSPGTFNILFPDTGVVYWGTQFRLPPGSVLSLRGEYPHARYLSFNSYNAAGQPVDRINDLLIEPEPGSLNPFRTGASRVGARRGYRVTLQPHVLTAGERIDDATRPANTLYIPDEGAAYQVWMRVYIPDEGRDVKGGVSLPKPELRLADGRTLEGQELCREIVIKEGAIRDYVAPAEALRRIFALPGARSPHHPAQPIPVWSAFFNPPLMATSLLINTPWEGLREQMDATRRGGWYSTLDNVYMSSYIDNRYGDVLVLHGKAPVTPRTKAGTATMAAAELRYWSVCKYRSTADTAVDACVYDEQAPLDAEGYYTIVVSTAAARPHNATAECGVGWLDWGTYGDGIGNPHGGMLLYRHMMPTPGFEHSLWATKKPGDEKAALGNYYPESSYSSRADFEARSCKK